MQEEYGSRGNHSVSMWGSFKLHQTKHWKLPVRYYIGPVLAEKASTESGALIPIAACDVYRCMGTSMFEHATLFS